MGKLLDFVGFFLERPTLTGAMVWGTLYVLKRRRKRTLSETEKEHALALYESQRIYADKMYDPPTEEELRQAGEKGRAHAAGQGAD